MLFYTLILSVAVLLHTVESAVHRIIDGSDTDINQYPHQISLRADGGHICGGSIYKSNIIITAAHCVALYDKESLSVGAGSSLLSDVKEVAQVKKIIVHENWNSTTIDNDIAILVLDRHFNFNFNSKIKPIRLEKDRQPSGLPVTAIGWGFTKVDGSPSNRLQHVDLELISNNECEKSYDKTITDHMLCAGTKTGGKAVCHTDSGGPLIFRKKLIGIVSFGYCDGVHPDVFASVPDLYDWIMRTIENNADELVEQ